MDQKPVALSKSERQSRVVQKMCWIVVMLLSTTLLVAVAPLATLCPTVLPTLARVDKYGNMLWPKLLGILTYCPKASLIFER